MFSSEKDESCLDYFVMEPRIPLGRKGRGGNSQMEDCVHFNDLAEISFWLKTEPTMASVKHKRLKSNRSGPSRNGLCGSLAFYWHAQATTLGM